MTEEEQSPAGSHAGKRCGEIRAFTRQASGRDATAKQENPKENPTELRRPLRETSGHRTKRDSNQPPSVQSIMVGRRRMLMPPHRISAPPQRRSQHLRQAANQWDKGWLRTRRLLSLTSPAITTGRSATQNLQPQVILTWIGGNSAVLFGVLSPTFMTWACAASQVLALSSK